MGSPIGPTLATSVLCYDEKRLLDKCLEEFKLVFTGDMWPIFLYFSERKNTLNYIKVTSARLTKILNLIPKKKPITTYLFQTLKYQETKISLP